MLAIRARKWRTKYGVLMPNPPGFANRWTFYIDKTGRSRTSRSMVKPANVGRGHGG
jgi:hypothetical protein